MATLFTRIIEGELPGRFVWRDDTCVAFLSINPLQPGHTLVVPIAEIDHWIDLDNATAAHCMVVAKQIARVQQDELQPTKVGLVVLGLEVPHVHVHVVPINGVHDLDFANADPAPDAGELDRMADRLRAALGTTSLA